jgi:hypothetical protein
MSTAWYLRGPNVNVVGETDPLHPVAPEIWLTATV